MTDIHMKAPKDTTTSNIEGHTYKIPKDGVIKVLSETHIPTLRRHGFSDHYVPEENLADKIDAMDDKDELVTFIEERGGEADSSMKINKLKKLAREVAGVEE